MLNISYGVSLQCLLSTYTKQCLVKSNFHLNDLLHTLHLYTNLMCVANHLNEN